MKKTWILVLNTGFSPQIWEHGDLFPITKYLNSSIIHPTLINHAQDLMCLKFRSNFKKKLHPTQEGAGIDHIAGRGENTTKIEKIFGVFQKSSYSMKH